MEGSDTPTFGEEQKRTEEVPEVLTPPPVIRRNTETTPEGDADIVRKHKVKIIDMNKKIIVKGFLKITKYMLLFKPLSAEIVNDAHFMKYF